MPTSITLLDGFKLLIKPGIKRYVVIPLCINIILFLGLFFISTHLFAQFNHWAQNYLPHWLQWLGMILWLIFFTGFLLVVIYFFVSLANLISAPFNGLLSEKIEFILTGKKLPEKSGKEIIKDIPRVVGRQIHVIAYYIPKAIFLLILFFIPVIQIFAAMFLFLFNAWFMTLQYLDYPADNHGISFQELLAWMKQNRVDALMFGISILIASMIPFLNLFVVPAAVAAGTKYWVMRRR